MKIAISNDVIKSVDVVKKENKSLSLVIDFQQYENCFEWEGLSAERIQMFLEFIGKNSLSVSKNIPVRIIGEILDEEEENGENNVELELIAIGDYLEDRWFVYDVFGESYIMRFDEIFEEDIELETII